MVVDGIVVGWYEVVVVGGVDIILDLLIGLGDDLCCILFKLC